MSDKSQRLMPESEIPSFVDELIKTGCDICAIGHNIEMVYHKPDAYIQLSEILAADASVSQSVWHWHAVQPGKFSEHLFGGVPLFQLLKQTEQCS